MTETESNDVVEDALKLDKFQAEEQTLSEAWQLRAQTDVKEDASQVHQNIIELRQLIDSAENEPKIPKDDKFLLKILRAKSHNLDAAMKMVCRYGNLRERYADNFKNSLPSLSERTFEHGIQTILEHRDSQARRVFVFKVSNWDPYLVTKEELSSANYLCLELMAREQKTQVSGIVALVDMAGLSWSHWMQMSMDYINSMVAMIQNSFPLRFKEIHIINESPIFSVAFALVSPFLTEKMRKRLRFHGSDLASLHQHLHQEILPVQYGGEVGEQGEMLDNRHVVRDLMDMEQFFEDLQHVGD